VRRSIHLCVVLAFLVSTSARAQDQEEEAALPDDPDPTRLDVERLPPEAIEITRDLYAHGFFLEGRLGGRGFRGGVGRLSDEGLYATIAFGYEVFSWFLIDVAVDGSIHGTDAPAPPSPTVFEVVGVLVEARIQLNLGARLGLWVGGEAGILTSTGDVLPAYGLNDSDSIGLTYGGSVGVDWHLFNRHHSIGLMGGARLYPTLDGYDGVF
jgi:hypothetical protein